MAFCSVEPYLPPLPKWNFPPLPPPVREVADIPADAVKLVPEAVTSNVFFIPSSGLVLKLGYNVKVAEADAMRFVARTTSIPVPTVHEAYEKDGIGYIYMSRLKGVRLSSIWKDLSAEKQEGVLTQLRAYVKELGGIQGEYYGGLAGEACKDVFFNHCCVAHAEVHVKHEYGPFTSRKEYNEGLVEALRNSRPGGELSAEDEELAAKVRELMGDEIVFSHGGLHFDHFVFDEEGGGVGVVGWGRAGWSIRQREYVQVRRGLGKRKWRGVLEGVFGEEGKRDGGVLEGLDGELVRYSVF